MGHGDNSDTKPRQYYRDNEIRLKELVNEQAADEGLWFVAQTGPEAYLQEQLRILHKTIEDL